MGLDPQVQETTVVSSLWGVPYHAATVQNILGRLRGTNNTKAVMLVAHYDSVPTGPGASDDGSGVATLLETARALKAGSRLRNDVIFLLTDGEELGMLGAQAFARQHPWAKDIGVVLNFEARGTSGPSFMFETSDGNGALISELGKAAPFPIATSLAQAIYDLLPNDTDFTILKQAGMEGLNFAYIGEVARYHTRTDDLRNLDRRSLQHDGSYALALASDFGSLDLPLPKRRDAVFFVIPRHTLIVYSQAWSAPLTLVAALIFVAVGILGLAGRRLTLRGAAMGLAAFVLSVLAATTGIAIVWIAVVFLNAVRFGRGYTNQWALLYSSGWLEIGAVALTVAIVSTLDLGYRRRLSTGELAIGALLFWLILMALSCIYMPGSAGVWPLIFALLALRVVFLSSEREEFISFFAVLLWVGALPAIMFGAPQIDALFAALTPNGSAAAGALVALQIGLMIPLLALAANPYRWLLPGCSLAVGLVCIVAGIVTAGFDANHPKPDRLFYAINLDSNIAVWASDRSPDQWTSQFLKLSPKRGPLPQHDAIIPGDFLEASAPAVRLPASSIQVLEDKTIGDIRSLRMHINSPRRTRMVELYVDPSTKVMSASVNGQPVESSGLRRLRPWQRRAMSMFELPEGQWGLHYSAMPEQGVELVLQVKPSKAMKMVAVDVADGLPDIRGVSLPPRPDYLMPNWLIVPVLGELSDSTLVIKSHSF